MKIKIFVLKELNATQTNLRINLLTNENFLKWELFHLSKIYARYFVNR